MSHPPPDETRAPLVLGVTCTLYVFVFAIFTVRIYSRIRPNVNLGWDDASISIAFIALSVQMVLLIVRVQNGFGRHNFYIPPEQTKIATHLAFFDHLLWPWGVAMCKISVAFTFLRIKRAKWWRMCMYLSNVVQLGTAITSNIVLLQRCRPIAAQWDPTITNAICWDPMTTQLHVYVNSGIVILTDFIFSLLPITFLRTINRPLREKIVLYILMSLSLVATAASIVKTVYIKDFATSGDNLWVEVKLTLPAIMEEQLGIIAVSIPLLKSVITRNLRRFGLFPSLSGGSSNHPSKRTGLRSHEYFNMGSVHPTSQRHTGQEKTGSGESEVNILHVEAVDLGREGD